jgi:hypothetical protein
MAVPPTVNGTVTTWLDGLESWAVIVATVPSLDVWVAAVTFTTGPAVRSSVDRRRS